MRVSLADSPSICDHGEICFLAEHPGTRVFPARLIRLFSRSSAATLCALLIGMFYLATFRNGHDWADDFSLYIRHAQNIARGEPYVQTGYIYNPQNPDIGPRVYPPGFPLLLAPVVRIFGLDLAPMKILVLAFFVGSLLVMTRLFRTVLPPAYVAVLVLVVGVNPFFWEFKDHVLSDMPFLFFVLLSLHLFTQADRGWCLSASRRNARGAGGCRHLCGYATRTWRWC